MDEQAKREACREYGSFAVFGPFETTDRATLLDVWVAYCSRTGKGVSFADNVAPFTELYRDHVMRTWTDPYNGTCYYSEEHQRLRCQHSDPRVWGERF